MTALGTAVINRARKQLVLARTGAAFLLLLLLPPLAFSAELLPKDLQEFLGIAASLPAELQAQATLRIAESARGLTAKQRQELISDAFVQAARAANPIRRIVPEHANPDSRQALKAKALGMKLDRLSLQMQAVQAMIRVNPAAARELFSQVRRPAIDKLTCDDALVPQIDAWYETAALLSQSAFSQKEIARQDHVSFLVSILAAVQSHYDLAPAANMVASASVNGQQFETLLTAYTGRLENISGEDRAFAVAIKPLRAAIGALAARNGSRAVLAAAFRKYVTANYGGAHCEDTAQNASSGLADWFNQELRGDLPPVASRARDPKETAEGRMKIDEYWTSEPANRLLTTAHELRVSKTGAPFTAAQRESQEWRESFSQFLEQLNAFTADSEPSALDFFHEKALVFESLLDLAPASGEDRAAVVRSFVAFLSASNVRESSPIEWLWHVQFINTRLLQSGNQEASARLMAAYRNSSDVALAFFARFSAQFVLFD